MNKNEPAIKPMRLPGFLVGFAAVCTVAVLTIVFQRELAHIAASLLDTMIVIDHLVPEAGTPVQ